MKHTLLTYMLFGAMAAPLAGGLLTSCKDQPDKYEIKGGVPAVNYIRLLSSEIKGNNDAPDTHYTNGELVEEASPQSVICLVGDNLRSVTEIWFNDRQATLNTSYMTDNTLIVSVPKSVPVDVTDKMYLKNKDGNVVEVPFHVVISAPVISSMENEYAEPGSRIRLLGQYFIDNEKKPLKIFFKDAAGANLEAEIKEYAEDFTYVDVIIPEKAVEGSISSESVYGTSSSAFHYQESRGLLFDFDGGGVPGNVSDGKFNHGWHGIRCYSDATSISGNYIQFGDPSVTLTHDAGWDDGNFSFEYWCGSWDTPQNIISGDGIALFNVKGADFSKPENMALKFEMCIPKENAWKAGALQIAFQPIEQITISGNPVAGYSTVGTAQAKIFNGEGNDAGDAWAAGDWGRAMYRPWTTTGSYDTDGKWITVTIPLSTFTFDRVGGKANKVPSLKTDFASLTMFLMGGGIDGTDCNPVIKIDNIRVVPNK